MKKKMSLVKSLSIKALIICGLFFGLSFLPEKSDLLASWLYSLTATASFLIIGSLFLERMEQKNMGKFFNFSNGLAFILLLVFAISWTDVFTEPYKDLIRWPMLISALIIFIAVFFGQMSLAAYEYDQRQEEEYYYDYYGYHGMAAPQSSTSKEKPETTPEISKEDKQIQQFHCQLTTPGLWPPE